MANRKGTNNDIQNTTKKTQKIEQHESLKNTGMNSSALEE